MKIQGSWESSTCSNEAGPAADWWRLLQRETAPARLLGQPSGGRRREQALLGLASNQRSMFFRVVLCMILCEQYQLRAEVRLFFHAILYVRKEYQVLLFFFFFFLKSAPPVFMADIYDCMSKSRTRSLRQRLLSAMMIPLPLYQRVCLNTCMTYIQWPSSRSLLSYCCTSSELPKYHNRLYIRALLLDGTIYALKLATHDDDDVLTLSIAHFPEISRVVT